VQGILAYVGEKRNAYIYLVRKHEGKRHLGMFKRRWEDNIKMDFKEIGCEGVDWIY
jgi:hypothetical protein